MCECQNVNANGDLWSEPTCLEPTQVATGEGWGFAIFVAALIGSFCVCCCGPICLVGAFCQKQNQPDSHTPTLAYTTEDPPTATPTPPAMLPPPAMAVVTAQPESSHFHPPTVNLSSNAVAIPNNDIELPLATAEPYNSYRPNPDKK